MNVLIFLIVLTLLFNTFDSTMAKQKKRTKQQESAKKQRQRARKQYNSSNANRERKQKSRTTGHVTEPPTRYVPNLKNCRLMILTLRTCKTHKILF
jgi:hypothetical protein